MDEKVTPEQIAAGFEIVALVGQLIRDSHGSQVPSGELYAQLMGKLTLGQYEAIIRILIKARMVEQKNHLLTWIGPDKS